jgi:hypothetical protein
MADRMDRASSCTLAAMALFQEYHHACSGFDWLEADRVRVRLIETIEASLDATAAVFKSLETNIPGARR